MLDSLDSYELSEWEAYDRIEPIDHAMRAELSAGITASTIANCNRGKDSEPFYAADFIQEWDRQYRDEAEAEEKRQEAVAARIEAAMAMLKVPWVTAN